MDELSFYIKNEELEETKKVVRSLSSLRFKKNPQTGIKECYISLFWDKKDLDELTTRLSDKYYSSRRVHN